MQRYDIAPLDKSMQRFAYTPEECESILGEYKDVSVDYLNFLLSEDLAFIAGGYARDLYHGGTPRDIDYWIQYNPTLDSVLYADNVQRMLNRLDAHGIPYIEYNMYGVNDERGRLAVYKIPGADLIFVDDVHSAIQGFDFNLNQYYIEPEAGPLYIGEGDPMFGLVQLKFDERCDRRLPKMQALWEKYYGK